MNRHLVGAVVGALLASAAFMDPSADEASAASASVEPTAVAAAVVSCHRSAYYPNVLISSARNMSCGAAARDMRRYRRPISRAFRTPGGFRCRRVSGMALGGQWRCVRGVRAYRFEFGD
ncbi:MAG TPA: hypothetical protein VLB47_05000 [Solirubrobacteraceae bacterium]|nr:hypothetical protein [Solirubrobacteraceae bacterium]